uniref:Lipoprotein n=1 Tax=Candidatus Enterococcus dunnyi TaxID=1834192 RepID=A0A200J0Q5_9ENTE|nr:hypothetical protein [Enterococcus sp. 9D6_DIV0238]OUZ30220.1 hypothetical protein A5889_002508 [Enterococcus sp. 9D6_DIV0238]
MNFLKKSIKNTFILMSVSIVFTGCSGTNNKTALSSSTPTESSQLTTKQKEAIDHGYQIGEYKLLLTNNQKKEEEQIFIENNFFEANFQKKQGDIDFSKKINILLYALHYSPEDEMYTLGTFIAVSYTHLDVYKRQANHRVKNYYFVVLFTLLFNSIIIILILC